jgi:hypothetical protein
MADKPFWETEQDLTDAEQERFEPDTDFESSNPDSAAASVPAAAALRYDEGIQAELEERAEAIQTVENDPDIPDRFEDDVYATDTRAEQALAASFARGLGAAQSTRGVESAVQWGFARVDDFAKTVKTGAPDDAQFTSDNDLLPFGHELRSVEFDGLADQPFVDGVPDDETQAELEPLFEERL